MNGYFDDIVYLPRTVNTISPWSDRLILESPYYLENKDEFGRLFDKFSEQVLNSSIANIIISESSNKKGFGVFAASDIPPGTLIGEYTGYLQTGCGDPYSWDYPEIPGYPELELSALKGGNETRFINHSFQPNCLAEHFPLEGIYVIIILSINTIKAGSELFLDYGDDYWLAGDREIIIEK